MKKAIVMAVVMGLLCSCGNKTESWSASEKHIILSQDDLMHVYTVRDSAELSVLRSSCSDLSEAMLQSNEYAALAGKMLATVTSPEQNGVGIAGPQVGISRRIVAVKRFDKEDEPFEVYPNIRIISMRGEMECGPEGCLSVPEMRGEVARYRDIDISYTDITTMKDTCERIQGFTAVIFQHECDHLDGVLYIDKASIIK